MCCAPCLRYMDSSRPLLGHNSLPARGGNMLKSPTPCTKYRDRMGWPPLRLVVPWERGPGPCHPLAEEQRLFFCFSSHHLNCHWFRSVWAPLWPFVTVLSFESTPQAPAAQRRCGAGQAVGRIWQGLMVEWGSWHWGDQPVASYLLPVFGAEAHKPELFICRRNGDPCYWVPSQCCSAAQPSSLAVRSTGD